MEPIILASASPRRHELVTAMGLAFTAAAPDVDERIDGTPDERVQRLAVRKAEAVRAGNVDRFILAADTLVAVDDEVFGKPKDEADALRMIRALSGRWHDVYSGVCVFAPGAPAPLVRCVRTHVLFADMTEAEILSYVSTGEPFGKAGAYAIQGRAGMYVRSIEGSFSNVIGLPTCAVREMLIESGFPFNPAEQVV